MKPFWLFQRTREHGHFACAASGDFLGDIRSSGFRSRWAHRLKVYVPICAVVFLFSIGSIYAQADLDFAKANQEYADGHFKNAISNYESLIGAGQWSANVFYDLGNAYFRAGDFGRAILNYQRALALEPHHPEATANLQIARDEAHALEMQSSWLDRYLRFATVNQYTVTAAAVLWIAAFCLAALIFSRRRSTAMIMLIVVMLLVFTGAMFAIWQLESGSKGNALAIVTGNNVQARLATADTANAVLALPAGSEVKILSTRGDWTYAALPNNLRGWIPAKDAEPVRL